MSVTIIPGLETRAGVRSLVRACSAAAIGALERVPPTSVLVDRRWSHDSDAEFILRAPTPPLDMASAPGLVRTIMPEFLAALSGFSAGARLLRECLQLTFDDAGEIAVPTTYADATMAAFVKEGDPIPVVQGITSLARLQPKKIAAIMMMTAEMVRSSNIEALMYDALTRACGLALDTVMFDDQPEDDTRPEGLRYGRPPQPASAAPDATNAMLIDIETLNRAVAPYTAQRPIFVMSGSRSLAADLRSFGRVPEAVLLLNSLALRGTKRIFAIARPAIASVANELPKISASRQTMLVRDVPPLVDAATSTAESSVWQVDGVAIKVRLPVTWVVRASDAVAWTQVENW